MLLPFSWLLLIPLFSVPTQVIGTFLTPPNMLTAENISKPGCPHKCGNLTIPYPFGIGLECSRSSMYTISCNTSYNPPKALLTATRSELDILDITETQMMLPDSTLASKCYDSQGNVIFRSIGIFDIRGSPFTISNISNKLTVIGCEDYAVLNSFKGTRRRNGRNSGALIPYRVVGCLVQCTYPSEVIQGSCSGSGCCQTTIPSGLQYFTIMLESLGSTDAVRISASQHCAYAFLAGDDSFSFAGTADFSRSRWEKKTEKQVMVLDWFVGDPNFSPESTGLLGLHKQINCSEAKYNRTSYACQGNTQCVDVDGGGYRCKCLSGYAGNPYLKPGCTDFDECSAGPISPCIRGCVNTPGSYTCSSSCPIGTHEIKSGLFCVVNNSLSSLKKITLGLSISLGLILLLFGGWWLYLVIRRRKSRRKIIRQKAQFFEQNGGLLLQKQMSSDESTVSRMRLFTADQLDKATDHFNEDRILGQGGQGTVYKGMLSDGKIIAIKKSKIVDGSRLEEFINEVVILSQINHRNIVKLLGCCLETEVPLLVYEFVPNGTLFHHIHYPSEDFAISWKMRLQIASDSATALAYLHSSSSIPIFHRDIKSSNILLDAKYRAKLSDFGTSRSVDIDQTHVTTRVMGTFGYLDPGYFQSSQFTEKSDEYSFGVVLVELLTGQKAIRATSEEDRSLTSWFLLHMENSTLLDIIDSQVLQEGSKEELFAVANLAKRCLNLNGKRRPSMKDVLMEIEAVISLCLLNADGKNCQDSKELLAGRTKNVTNNGLSGSRTFYLENCSDNSAEISLLFNPR